VRFQREFLLDTTSGDMNGDRVLAEEFKPLEKVDVIGVSKVVDSLCRQAPSFPRFGCDARVDVHRAPGSIAHRVFRRACFRYAHGRQMGNAR